MLNYRPTHEAMGRFRAGDWHAIGEHGEAEGRDCTILRKVDKGLTESCWVDPSAECLLVRYQTSRQGQVRIKVDISYQQTDSYGWVPSSWRCVQLNGDGASLKESSSARVTHYELAGVTDQKAFRLDYPPGTEVVDHKTGKTYIELGSQHTRIVTADDRTHYKTYEEMLAASKRELYSGYWTKAVWAIIVLAVCAFGYRAWRRRFRANV